MENQRNNKGVIALLIVIIVMLATLCILFATGTISFNSGDVNNENITSDETTNENNDSNSQKNNYDAWMNYILEQNITSVKISSTIVAESPNDYYQYERNLTTTKLKEIFNKLMNYKLVKYYHQGLGSGAGDSITISYSKNSDNYSVEIFNGIILINEDKDLLNALENSKDGEENEVGLDKQGECYSYKFQGNILSILDEYFQ